MSAPHSDRRHPSRPFKKVVRKFVDAAISEPVRGRPSNVTPPSAADGGGPYFLDNGADVRGQGPVADQALTDRLAATRDMQDKVIADAYRRGLRIRGLRKFTLKDLSFITDELDDVVTK
jgi:hypothetical protein